MSDDAWITAAWTVQMSDQTERTVYAATAEAAMELMRRKLARDGSNVRVLEAWKWGEDE